jgi:nitroreductase
MLKDLILKNRSYRRFDENYKIDRETLEQFIDLARCSASGRNAQPLKYYLACTPEINSLIFPTLAWAAYLKEWEGPIEGERPTAYLVMMGDKTISENYFCDHGIAAQSILLGAVEKDLGGCIIASVKRMELKKTLNLPDHLEILQVLALGKPIETIVLEELESDGYYKYWRDENQVHHVPKRKLEDIIIH